MSRRYQTLSHLIVPPRPLSYYWAGRRQPFPARELLLGGGGGRLSVQRAGRKKHHRLRISARSLSTSYWLQVGGGPIQTGKMCSRKRLTFAT